MTRGLPSFIAGAFGLQTDAARFGRDALRFVNTDAGRDLRLRGLNARVVVSGPVRTGDVIRKELP